jgi:hypothetical protein
MLESLFSKMMVERRSCLDTESAYSVKADAVNQAELSTGSDEQSSDGGIRF